jgi:hypothetical protein
MPVDALLVPSLEGVWALRRTADAFDGLKLIDAGPRTSTWPFRGHSEAIWVRTRNGDWIVTVRPWHDGQIVAYPVHIDLTSAKCAWGVDSNHFTILDDFEAGGHDILAIDLHAAGNQDVFVGFRGGHNSKFSGVVQYAYKDDAWHRIGWIFNGSVSAIFGADLDQDGRVDLAIVAWGKTGDARISVLYGE